MITLIVPQTAGIFCDKLHVIFICNLFWPEYVCLKYLISKIHIVRNFRGFACRCFQSTINLLNGHKFKLFCPEYWFLIYDETSCGLWVWMGFVELSCVKSHHCIMIKYQKPFDNYILFVLPYYTASRAAGVNNRLHIFVSICKYCQQ